MVVAEQIHAVVDIEQIEVRAQLAARCLEPARYPQIQTVVIRKPQAVRFAVRRDEHAPVVRQRSERVDHVGGGPAGVVMPRGTQLPTRVQGIGGVSIKRVTLVPPPRHPAARHSLLRARDRVTRVPLPCSVASARQQELHPLRSGLRRSHAHAVRLRLGEKVVGVVEVLPARSYARRQPLIGLHAQRHARPQRAFQPDHAMLRALDAPESALAIRGGELVQALALGVVPPRRPDHRGAERERRVKTGRHRCAARVAGPLPAYSGLRDQGSGHAKFGRGEARHVRPVGIQAHHGAFRRHHLRVAGYHGALARERVIVIRRAIAGLKTCPPDRRLSRLPAPLIAQRDEIQLAMIR